MTPEAVRIGPGEGDPRRSAPHVARNAAPIAEVLRGVLPERGLVLEIASGSGEHALHFAREFPESAVAAERSRSGGVPLDRGVAGRGRPVQPAAADPARRARGAMAGGAAPTRSCASTWSISAPGRRPPG